MKAKKLYDAVASTRQETATAPYAIAHENFLLVKFLTTADDYIDRFLAGYQSVNNAADALPSHAAPKRSGYHIGDGQAAAIFVMGTRRIDWLNIWRDTRVYEPNNEYVSLQTMMSSLRSVAGNIINPEFFERHNASARYFTKPLLNSFDRELFDSILCSKLVWARLKTEYKKSNPKDVRKLERKLTHWTKDKGLSIRRAWVQLLELSTKLVEADESKAPAFTEASLFGYLLDTVQHFFEENEESDARDLSALAARPHNQNFELSRSSNRQSRRFSTRSQNRDPLLDADGNETCYICSGMNHHARSCKYRHKVRKYGERLRLQDEEKEQTSKLIGFIVI
ncbi:hypothetical protein OnM2_084034 [Erysiphe neolycopersici]|uniref:Uncharacterized protein n=1 Tax=Erysiphe neolycopersici TaxID=212602 RepID=A0A420HEZ3_9PEZI|nr:hypothetical protein OnM2_084034 [Erysiphe neolycopersici]